MNTDNRLPLEGVWDFFPDHGKSGESLGFQNPDFSTRFWGETWVPSCFENGMPDFDYYDGVCWYRRRFRFPPGWREKRVVLHFEGVNSRARVWLNGVFLGENRDGFLPFEYEIAPSARWDAENVLVVSVDNSHHEGDVPGMHVGWRNYGGILREVSLYATEKLYIKALHVDAEPVPGGGRLECDVLIENRGAYRPALTCNVNLYEADQETTPIERLSSEHRIDLQPGETKSIRLGATLKGVRPWTPQDPRLYRVEATLGAKGEINNKAVVRTGFRRIQAKPDGLFLNGEKVFLTGFNRHEDSPRTAMASDPSLVRRDLELMKSSGCNFLRLCHYPHHPLELDLCDELGLLTFCEIPLYYWKGKDKKASDYEDGRRNNAVRLQSAARQLERLIERDRNHPSVIFWSVSNETPELYPEVAEGNCSLINLARKLDPSRLCVHVSNHWKHYPNFQEDDVICINDYPTLSDRRTLRRGAEIPEERKRDNWRRDIEELHVRYPEKPIFITEFGFLSFAGMRGLDFGEDDHARALEDEFHSLDATYICGACLWCWADHPWPLDAMERQGLGTSPYGVLSRSRRPLIPFYSARKLFRAQQGIQAPEPDPDSDSGQVSMLRPSLDTIPKVPFPSGFGIRTMTREDIGLWTDIQRDAEPYLKIENHTFQAEFGENLEAIQWRCFIVTSPDGLGVGVSSAWFNRDFRGQEYGRIHWIAIRPSWQGQGLGKATLAYSMRQLARWHKRAYLLTNIRRLPALKMYLDFGFEPDLYPPKAQELWQKVDESLDHPVLAHSLKNIR